MSTAFRLYDPREMPQVDTHRGVAYHWRVWQLTGLLRPENVSPKLYLAYALVLNTLITLLFPLTLLAKLFFTSTLRELCENLSITITDIAANFKFVNVFLVRKQLQQIRLLLLRMDQRAMRTENADELEALQQSVRQGRTAFCTFAGIFVFGTLLSCFRVAIAKKRTLLYPAWFGVDWTQSDTAYILICTYQLLALIVQAVQDCANDSYPPAYLCIITGHMRALELRVRRLGYRTLLPFNFECWQRASYEELCDCIEYFLCILRLHGIIQQILSIACLAQFMCSSAVQCTVAMHFLFVSDSHDLSAMVLSTVFFVSVTLEVFIICYFGDRMRAQSEQLLHAFYSCNWLAQGPQFRRSLIISMIRAQRPSVIYAGGYIALSLETFVAVMRFTYSVFTVLLQAREM